MKGALCIAARGACLLLAVGMAACGSGSSARSGLTVARVGESTVSRRTLEHWSSIPVNLTGPHASTRTREALALLISGAWIEGEAHETGITVNDGEVANAITLLSTAQSESLKFEEVARAPFFRLIGLRGETRADRSWLMRLNLLALHLEEKWLRDAEQGLPAAQVARYYTRHLQRFVVPEQRDLAVIGNEKRAVVVRAKKEIEAGADFIEVAKRLSDDAEAPGGLQLHLQRGQEEPEYEQHVFSAKLGVLYGPISQVFYYIFEVLKVRPPHLLPLAQVQRSIRARIVAAERQTLLARRRRQAVEAWTARTRCSSAYAVPQCGHTL